MRHLRGSSQKDEQPTVPAPSRLRELREERGLTQVELARLAGMHVNSYQRLESGIWKEASPEHAAALAAALRVRVPDLGLAIRSGEPPPSIRFRKLTLEQRQFIDELLSLSPEELAIMRSALRYLRSDKERKRKAR